MSTAGIRPLCLAGLLAVVPVLAAAPAAAGVFEANGEIGFDLGGIQPDGGRDDHEESRIGIRGGYHLNDRFQLEGQLFGFESDEGRHRRTFGAALINAVFNFHPNDRTVPYLLVGVGAVDLDLDDDRHSHGHSDDDEEQDALQLAVGSRFFFGQGRTGIRIEASLLAFEDDFGRDRELLSFVGGLTWRLGKYRPSKVTVVGQPGR